MSRDLWMKLLLLAGAGALGTLARVGVITAVHRWTQHAYPWGTLAVNVLGCGLFGLGWAIVEQRTNLHPMVKLAIFTGFLGAFTTFSTYAYDLSVLAREGRWAGLAALMLLHNALGLLAFVGGWWLGGFAKPA